jgi:hypothetical protein
MTISGPSGIVIPTIWPVVFNDLLVRPNRSPKATGVGRYEFGNCGLRTIHNAMVLQLAFDHGIEAVGCHHVDGESKQYCAKAEQNSLPRLCTDIRLTAAANARPNTRFQGYHASLSQP